MEFVGRGRDAVKRSRTSLEGNRDPNCPLNSRQTGVLPSAKLQSPLFPCHLLNSGLYLSRNRVHKRSSSVETTQETVNASIETYARANRPIPSPFRPSSDPFSVISVSFPGCKSSNRPRRSLISPSPRLTSLSPLARAVSRPYPLSSAADSPFRRVDAMGEVEAIQSRSTADSCRDAPLPCQSSIFLPSSATRIPLSCNTHLLQPRAPVLQEPFPPPGHSPSKSFPRHVFNARHYRKPFPSLFVP